MRPLLLRKRVGERREVDDNKEKFCFSFTEMLLKDRIVKAIFFSSLICLRTQACIIQANVV